MSAVAGSGFDIMNFVGMKIQATEAPAPPRELGALARAVAAEPVADAISPVVLIGLVRLAEFLCIAAIGAAAYVALVYRYDDFEWAYAGAIVWVSATGVFAFQVFDIYSV